MGVYECMWMPRRPEEGGRFAAAGLAERCELPNVRPSNWTPVLIIKQKLLLNTEPYL